MRVDPSLRELVGTTSVTPRGGELADLCDKLTGGDKVARARLGNEHTVYPRGILSVHLDTPKVS